MDEVFFYGDESLLVSGIKRKKLSKGTPFDSFSNTRTLYTK